MISTNKTSKKYVKFVKTKIVFLLQFLISIVFLLSILEHNVLGADNSIKNITDVSVYFRINSSLNIIEVLPFTYNDFYSEKYYQGSFDTIGISMKLFDDTNNNLLSKEINSKGQVIFLGLNKNNDYYYSFNDLEPSDNLEKLSLLFTNPKQELNFCDNDGVCEPCLSGFCNLLENYAVCSDCSSGEKDNYCDLVKDNICDPDCDNLDPDCDCKNGLCYVEKDSKKISCSSLGGQGCLAYEECKGSYIYSDDYGTKCCKGTCINPNIKDDSEILKEVRNPNNKKISSEQNQENDIYEQTYFDTSEKKDVSSYNVLLVFFLMFSLIALTLLMTYFFHKESSEHFDNPIIRYIDNLFQQGYTKEQILSFMQQHGYTNKNIESVFKLLKK